VPLIEARTDYQTSFASTIATYVVNEVIINIIIIITNRSYTEYWYVSWRSIQYSKTYITSAVCHAAWLGMKQDIRRMTDESVVADACVIAVVPSLTR